MALTQKSPYNYQGLPCNTSLQQFETVNRCIKEKRTLVSDAQNELDLLEQQAMRIYRDNVSYVFSIIGNMKDLQNWIHMQQTGIDMEGKKLDRRRKYPEKESAMFFVDRVQQYLGIDDMEPVAVVEYNWGEADHIEFMSHGHKWMLSIPNVRKVDIRSFRDDGERVFMLELWHVEFNGIKEYCRIGSTFEEEELGELMKKGIEKYCVGEEGSEDE